MYRVDNLSAVPTLPVAPPPGIPGFYSDGNPAAGLDATMVDAWWLNQLQEEILTVVEAVGMAPNKASHRQLYEAIRAIALDANPDLSGYLPLAGGTLTGDLAINTNLWVQGGATAGSLSVTGGANVGGDLALTGSGALTRPSYAADRAIRLLQSGGGNLAAIQLAADYTDCTGELWANTLRARGGLVADATLYTAGHATISTNLYVGWDLSVTNSISTAALYASGNISGGWDISAGNQLSAGSLSVGGHASLGTLTVNSDVYMLASLYVPYRLECGTMRATGDCEITAGLAIGTLGGSQLGVYGPSYLHGDVAALASLSVSYDLVVGSAAYKPGGGMWSDSSDVRLKKDIEPYKRGLAAIRQLEPVEYAHNGLGGTLDDGRRHIGLVAQDCREAMREMVGERPGKLRAEDIEDTEILTLDCTPLTFALVNAVQELATRLENLEDRHGSE